MQIYKKTKQNILCVAVVKIKYPSFGKTCCEMLNHIHYTQKNSLEIRGLMNETLSEKAKYEKQKQMKILDILDPCEHRDSI